MSVKLLTEHHMEFLSLKGGCAGSPESTLVKIHIVGNHMTRLISQVIFFIYLFFNLFTLIDKMGGKFSHNKICHSNVTVPPEEWV